MSKIQMIFRFLLLGGYAVRNTYCEELFPNDDFRLLPGGSRPQWSQYLFLGSQNTQNPHSNGYFYQIDPHKRNHHKIISPNERLRVPLLINQMKNFRLYEQRNNKELQETLHGRGTQTFNPRRDFQANNQQRPHLKQNNGYFSGAPQGIGSANLERNGYQIPNKRILGSASVPIKAELNEQTYFSPQNFEHIKMNTESARLHRDPLRENLNQRINAHRIPIQIAESNGQTGLSHQNVEHVKVNAETAQFTKSLQRENQNERINIKSQKVSAIVPRKQFCNLAPCLNDSAEFASKGNTNGIKNGSPIAFLNNNPRPQSDNRLQGKNMNQSLLRRNITRQSTPESIIKPQNSQQSFIRSNVKPSHFLEINLKTQENRTKLDEVQSPASITTHKSKIKKIPSTNQIRGSQRYWRKVTRVQSIPSAQDKQLIQDSIITTTERSITSVQQLPHQANTITTTENSKLHYTVEDALFSDSFSTPLFGQRLRHVKPLSQQNKKTNIQNLSSIAIDSSKTENLQTSQLNYKTLNNIKRKQYENSLAELNKTIFSLFWNSERLPIKNESQNSVFKEDLLQENVPEIGNIKSTTHGRIDNGSLKLVSYPDYILSGTPLHSTGEDIYTTKDIPSRKLKPNSFTTIKKIGMTAEQDGGKQKPKQPFQSISSHQSVLEREISPLEYPQVHLKNISSYTPTSTPAHHRPTDPYISQTEEFYKQERPNNDMKNLTNRNSNKQKLNAGFQSFRSQPVEIERETNPLDSPQQHNTESYELTATTELQKPTEPNIFQTDYIKGLKNAVLKFKVQVLPISKNETSEKNDAETKPHSVHHLHVFTNVYSKLPPNQIQSYFAPVKQYYIPPSHYHYPKFSYAPDPVSNPQNQFSLITPSFQEWQQQERNKTVKPTIRDQEPIIDNSDLHFSAKSAFSRNTEVTPATETTTLQPHKSKTVKSASQKLEKIREKEETDTSTTVVSSGSHNQVFHFGLNGSFKPVINVISAKTSELPREVYDKQKNFKNDNHRGMQFSPAPEVSTNSKIKCDTHSFSGSSVNCNSNLENENAELEITSTESKNKDRLIATESPAVSNQSGKLKTFIPIRKVPFRFLTNRENQKSSLQTESLTTLKQQNNFHRNNTMDTKTHAIWSKNRGSKNDSISVSEMPTVSKKQNYLYRSLNGNRGISILQSLRLENSPMMKSTAYLARNNSTSNLYNMKTPYTDGKSFLPQIKDTHVNNRKEKANISNFSLHSSDNNSSQDSITQPLTKISQVKNKDEPPTITGIKKNNNKLIYPTKDEFPFVKQDDLFLLNLSQVPNFNQNVSSDLTKLTQSSDDGILSDSKRKEVKLHANETKETFKAIVSSEIDENNATTAEPHITTVTTDSYNEIRETTTFKSQTDLENKVYISTTNDADSMISTTENPKSKYVLSTNVIESTLKVTSNGLLEYVSATSILDDVSTEKPTTDEFSSKHSTEFGTIIENIPFFEESGKMMMKIEKQKPEAKHSIPSDKDLSQNKTENSVKTDEESNQNTTQSMNILNEFQNVILLQQPLNISTHSQGNNSTTEEIFRTKEDLKINEKNKPKTSNEKDFNSNEGIVLTERTTPMQKIRTADFTEINHKNETFSDITHNKTVESLNERPSENITNLDISSLVDELGIDIKTPVNRISNFTEQQNNQNSIVTATHEPSTTELIP